MPLTIIVSFVRSGVPAFRRWCFRRIVLLYRAEYLIVPLVRIRSLKETDPFVVSFLN